MAGYRWIFGCLALIDDLWSDRASNIRRWNSWQWVYVLFKFQNTIRILQSISWIICCWTNKNICIKHVERNINCENGALMIEYLYMYIMYIIWSILKFHWQCNETRLSWFSWKNLQAEDECRSHRTFIRSIYPLNI